MPMRIHFPNITTPSPVSIGLVAGALFFGILNNVGGAMMARSMVNYPAWLLYGTTILYVIIFGVMSIPVMIQSQFKEKYLTWKIQKQFVILGLITVVNGLFFQFSDPFVDGSLQQILGVAQPVCVFLISLLIFPSDKFRCNEYVGSAFVVAGMIIGILGSKFTERSSVFASIMFFLSVVAQSVEIIYQDKAFREHHPPPALCLFFYNLYSIPFYLFSIPGEAIPYLNGESVGYTFGWALTNQKHAFQCFFDVAPQSEIDAGHCVGPNPWAWPMVFVAGYVGSFYFNAKLIDRFNSTWLAILFTIVSPLSVAVFAIPEIVGQASAESLTFLGGFSFCVILFGILVKGGGNNTKESRSINNDVADMGYMEIPINSQS